ncbi:MAG: FAD-dependent oxidoreductase [Nitrospira sp.]|nr:FAD-dependent oxidoreductase [Nitrospira sp.]
MKIAVVGTGIAGMVAAYLLHQEHEITVFEANDYIGGHTNTIDVEQDGSTYAVDTGFIVYNDWTYPHFVALLAKLGIASQPSTMSFSVKDDASGLEYNGTTLNTLFAQRRNLLRPSFYRMITDILRFNREARALLDAGDDTTTLHEYLTANRYSAEFREHYIIPMGAAIWSTDPVQMGNFPARYFVRFFDNHGMLSVDNRPQWRVVQGGSKQYVEALTRPYRSRIRLCCPVRSIRRFPDHVAVGTADGRERFDQVIMATHSDQALALLADPTGAERDILGAIRFQANEAVLHMDRSLLPKRRLAWASWNYHLSNKLANRVAVTYHMNTLQNLRAPREFCVTLNRSEAIDPAAIIKRITYHHPVYTREAVAAQRRHAEINGVQRTYYCGAYWNYGFHEDGVKSALAVCGHFGKGLDS